MYRVTASRAVDPQLAPDVALGPPAAPPIAPGMEGTILQPGQANTVTSTFENDGATGLDDVSLRLSAPTGWDVEPVTTSTSSLGRGQSFTATWRVTPPADAKGTSTLSVAAGYSWSGHAGTASAQRDVTAERLTTPTGSPYLSDLDWIDSRSDFSTVRRDLNYYGGPLTIHGVTYAKGLWANANATVDVYLGGNCSRLTADLGMDDSDRGQGTIDYQLYLDGTKVYDSGVVRNATPTIHLDQDVSGAKVLRLVVSDAGDGISYDNADVGEGRLTCAS
jgi:alpha-galactosidase